VLPKGRSLPYLKPKLWVYDTISQTNFDICACNNKKINVKFLNNLRRLMHKVNVRAELAFGIGGSKLILYRN